jgi:ABC-type Zn2+ transport system substrate-binding protein/surface adhesin
MGDVVAIVTQENTVSVSVAAADLVTAQSNLAAPAVVESISDIANVDTTTNGVTQGSILIFQTSTSKWTASTTLQDQDMEGGEF